MMNSKRLEFLEIARTIAMAWVVFFHVFELAYVNIRGESWLTIIVSTISRFTVPTFFIISGFLLGYRYLSSPIPFDKWMFLKRKLFTLGIPFIVWNILYMFIFHFFWGWQIFNPNTLFNLITGYMHLYFIFVLFQFFLIYTFLHPFMKKEKIILFLVLSTLVSMSFYAISDLLVWKEGRDGYFFEWHYGKLFLGWCLFFFWGIWMGSKIDILEIFKKHWLFLLMVSGGSYFLFVLETYYELKWVGESSRQFFLVSGLFFQFLFSTFLLILFYGLVVSSQERWWRPIFTTFAPLGKDMYGIYLSHIAILIGTISIWKMLSMPEVSYIKIPVIFIATALISWIFLRICYMPGFRFLSKLLLGHIES